MKKKTTESGYPISLEIDYPKGDLNRLTSFFRLFAAIPIAVILALVSGSISGWRGGVYQIIYAAGGMIVVPTALMLLFRWKYPRWWFDWNVNLANFGLRVGSYFLLLTDVYPSTDKEQSVHLTVPYPDPKKDLQVGMVLVKWFLAIPHYVILGFLGIAALAVTVYAWFAILFTGRYPKGSFEFVVAVMRWCMRVSGYAFLLVTDVYPPFRLD
jgi:hypothetical protein